MKACIWCGRPVIVQLSLPMIWHWRPAPMPAICQVCQARLRPLTGPQCSQCARQQATTTPCHDCQRWGDELVNHAIFPYDATLKAYMQQYKFQGDYQLRLVMQPAISRALAALNYDVLVPIPLAVATWQTRGFNQVTGWLTTQPYYQALTVRATQKLRPQSSKTRAERLQTPQPFALVPTATEVLRNQRVLLLDDVYTTGRTLRHAAQQIYFGGAKAVTS